MPKVFIIGHFDHESRNGNCDLAKRLSEEHEVFILCYLKSKEARKRLSKALENYKLNLAYLLELEVKKEDLDMQIEHAYIDKCLKAIQLEKPSVVYLKDDGEKFMNENMLAKIRAHSELMGAELFEK